MKSVSVIIPNFNGRQHLGACLNSIQQQQYRSHEVILFDNGSQDQSISFVQQKFPSVRTISAATNLGFAGAINRAAHSATGEWLAFLNNDMKAAPGWIEAAMAHADRHPCIASRILNWSGDKVDFDGGSLQYLGFADQVGVGESSRRDSAAAPILFPCGGAMFIRKDLFLESGGFDEDYFAVYEDVDLGWRLWIEGSDILFEPASTAYHRGHVTLDSRPEEKKRYLMHRNALFTIIKNYDEDAFRKIVPLAFFQAIRRAVRFAGIDKTAFYFWEEPPPPQDAAAWWMWKDAINHLVALDDVIERWPQLMAKRQAIQQRRKRADSEFTALFRDPFRRIFKDYDYEACEAEWVRALGIPELFPQNIPFAFTEAFDKEQKLEIERLRRELALLKSRLQGSAAATAKPGRMRRLAKRLTPGR
ncbi:MAG TPA: glycosyltransferase family 2 protein [Acidobacteriota bacterium]|jgi:hypothetical protein|nr:glycosyltransferase family 2 protein [Acidobacteriota bacterium]